VQELSEEFEIVSFLFLNLEVETVRDKRKRSRVLFVEGRKEMTY
jgi:hypothetical protein